ncbi:peptide deformylase [Sphaerisporangium fuscum]|uniref:peptide deformylase n=1 Tax=Sphaerisporangium fuscum TaxID=2835868 RepID=UPI0027E25899|nr:peptide deformylase [Sphaerisporangium fuscum]
MKRDEDEETPQALSAFIAELRHWREVTGLSQKALARLVGYTPSYISKVERGSLVPSREFAENADRHLRAGNAIIRRWKDVNQTLGENAAKGHQHDTPVPVDDPQSKPSAALVVEHERAELSFDSGLFKTRIRRQLRNVGAEPVTRYLIRIAVDRYPGDPERSNQLYRKFPLTWEEIGLSAVCGDEPMTWRVQHDRDAFKEVWLLFENADGRFPLYPGESTWIDYVYTVSADKWGPWWQRAIRLPTQRLSLALDFPEGLQPVVWGIETSMTAEASPFKTPIYRETRDGRVYFTWSTEDPPLHARYRIEWKFKSPKEESSPMETLSPSEQMRSIGIVQEGDPILTETARPFDLPTEAEDARRVVAQLVSNLERVSQVHSFAKGMGLAAPQIGIGRAAALVRTPTGEIVTLLNPRVINESSETDEQYEGCLSFFDVRGMVPRPLSIEVEHQDIDGNARITLFEEGMARLVGHEIDHLYGQLYRVRMRAGVEPIPVSQYKGTGQQWNYPTR